MKDASRAGTEQNSSGRGHGQKAKMTGEPRLCLHIHPDGACNCPDLT